MSPTAEAEARSSEQIKEEVKRSVEAKTEAQLNQEFVRAMDEAQALEELLNTEVEHNPHSTGNAVYEKPENLTKGTTVKKAVLETVVAIQEGKVTVGDPTANEVLKSIANLTLDKINERTAPYLYRIIQRAKQNRFRTGNDIVEALGEIRNLKKVSYGLYQTLDRRLRDRLASMEPDQERRGKILERLDTMLQREREAQPAANAETTQTPADTVNEKRERNGFNNFLRYYGQYFTEKEDIELVEAIFDPEGKFVELLQSIKDEVGPNGKDVSNRLELKVVGLFSKLFAKVDRSNPEEFFENVIQQDPQRGIQSTFLSLRNALDSLYTHYQSKGGSDQRVRESLGIEAFNKRVNFIKDSHIEVELDVPETDTEGNVIPTGAVDEHGKQILQMKKVKRPYVVLDPTRRNTKASLAELIQHVGMTVDNEFNVRSYTHNVSAILYRNAPDAEKGGFYGQLAGYASKMKGRNLDAMFALPDADIVAQAHRLYNKYLTEEFAKNDWRHNVPLFHRDAVHRTKVQNEIIAALKGMYMDGTRVKTSEQWRLDRALDIAIGQARGVTMDETELAAYADPQMDPDGKGPYYGDYYPNVAALEHFNYAHATYRWQSEGAMPPMLFFPVESADGKPLIFKNHEQYLDYMTKYRDSFLKGNKDIKGVKLIADFLMNPGNIGSFVKRGDWRFLEAYKGYFENPTLKGVDKKNINHLTNWKTIENIGYEVLLTYREHIMNDEFIKGNPAKRDELFEYLMEKYIRPTLPPGENNISLEEYKHRVEHMLHEEHEHAPKG
ncbi:MAG TPA: hypothetical protein VK338_06705, partial [Candidatus Nitrosocosmicus sp.]|nr:hypothetical protein [Candidatus Nitrosocosmicus sp.]